MYRNQLSDFHICSASCTFNYLSFDHRSHVNVDLYAAETDSKLTSTSQIKQTRW